MANAIVHRGPDEVGYFQHPGIGFASRRLSIVGLGDGQQPIFNEDKSVCVVFNGEIFDYVEKRAELKERGHVFKTGCDTEVLPHLWEDCQENVFEQLRGQFAFALFDKSRQKVVLARDRFGICPLYWTRTTRFGNDWLLFASEIKALLATGLIDPSPDRRGIDAVFNFAAVPGPESCFEGIQLLPPGKFLTVSLGRSGEDAKIEERTYWAMDFPDEGEEERGQSQQKLASEFEGILYSAVERRLRADVPVVSYLSGGVDSSIVVAMAKDILGTAPTTFTSQILDPSLDETEQAAGVSSHLSANQFVVECGPNEIVSKYQDLLFATESPVVDTSSVALMLLARKVHQEGFKVALTGEGSDEWLAGYPWYRSNRILNGLGQVSGGLLNKLARRGLRRWLGWDQRARAYWLKCIASAGGQNAFHDFYGLINISRSKFLQRGHA